MSTAMAMHFVIPAQAGIQRLYLLCSWLLSRYAGFVQLAGFPPARE